MTFAHRTLVNHGVHQDAPVQPSLVIAYLCGNDSMGAHPSGLGPHVPLPEYIENLKKILDHLKSLSETTRVIILTCPPVNEELYRRFSRDHLDVLAEIIRTNEDLRKYSEACVQVCKEMDVKVIDLFTAIQEREDWVTSCLE
ncbi:uncharacterized protein A4U43_C07F21010 [Asparagus officinalis]|uniref:SGNH hydrolase-type esterase domain-containing protein n=1 Tax=Asparagus officinalis TaxID=4686 RepID=A0A5P1EDZ5_ASPOF|nr:uncharacterized protein A4U43_C07F21010 [Asparagus officinalis]